MRTINHILLFEPRTEGHHIPWLCLVAEAFLKSKVEVSIAIDNRTSEAMDRIHQRSKKLLNRVNVYNIYNDDGELKGGNKPRAAAECFYESKADELFCNALDEFASNICRKAVFGYRPPKILKGKISGVYIRPRPLDNTQGGFKNYLKRMGFWNLTREGWFKNLFLLDEYLVAQYHGTNTPLNLHFLPDPWDTEYPELTKDDARLALNIPRDRFTLLHYGTASRRKGLKFLLDTLEGDDLNNKIFLLVAGDIGKDKSSVKRLKAMEERGRARLLNYYVSPDEEKQCFKAADFIALPYLNHYGSSGILSNAAAAGRPVIASDYHIIGERVREHSLGYTFQNANDQELKFALKEASETPERELRAFEEKLKHFSKSFSPKAFKKSLMSAYCEDSVA